MQSELFALLPFALTHERRTELIEAIGSPRWEGRWLFDDFDDDGDPSEMDLSGMPFVFRNARPDDVFFLCPKTQRQHG